MSEIFYTDAEWHSGFWGHYFSAIIYRCCITWAPRFMEIGNATDHPGLKQSMLGWCYPTVNPHVWTNQKCGQHCQVSCVTFINPCFNWPSPLPIMDLPRHGSVTTVTTVAGPGAFLPDVSDASWRHREAYHGSPLADGQYQPQFDQRKLASSKS